MLEPGQVFSDGAFKRMLDLADEGKLMIMTPELPVSHKYVILAFQEQGAIAGHRLAIPPEELASLVTRSLYPEDENAFRPNLMALVYNNPEGKGYLALECFALLCGAKRAVGVYDDEVLKEISFKHAIGYVAAKAVKSFVIYPAAMFTFASFHLGKNTGSWIVKKF